MNDTIDTTLATTTETPAAAPATSAPSPSAASQRPTSASELATWMEKADAAPQDTTDPATEAPAATAQAETAKPEGELSPSAKEGPIPFAVHKTALDNARTKERTAVEAEWQPYAWAKSVPRESLEHMSNIAQRMTADPLGFLESYEKELLDHPTYGPQLRSRAGRTLAGARSQAPDAEPDADVQITDAQGNVTGLTYSAKQLAQRDAWRERQLLAKVEQTYGPIKQAHDRSAQLAQAQAKADADMTARVDANAKHILALVDGNEQHAAAVVKTMAEHREWTPVECALHVRDTVIVGPRLSLQAQKDALDTINKKAAGNTVAGTGAGATAKRPQTREELRTFLEQNAR